MENKFTSLLKKCIDGERNSVPCYGMVLASIKREDRLLNLCNYGTVEMSFSNLDGKDITHNKDEICALIDYLSANPQSIDEMYNDLCGVLKGREGENDYWVEVYKGDKLLKKTKVEDCGNIKKTIEKFKEDVADYDVSLFS